MRRLVSGIDHVFLPVSGATAALGVLVTELRLPLVFPMRSFGSFSSGGITLGNLNVELIEDSSLTPWLSASSPHRIKGIVLEPSSAFDESYLIALDERHIPHTPPMPQMGASLDDQPLWTNIWLLDFISEDSGVVICAYQGLETPDASRRRALLDSVAGGELGVVEARDLIVATTDVDAATLRWSRLLDEPTYVASSPVWELPRGPRLRLVPGDKNQIFGLTLAARDPALAATTWKKSAGPLTDLRLDFVAAE